MFLASTAAALEPNGTAAFSELGKQLYLGTLFLDSPSQSAEEILASPQKKRLELRFTGTMSKRSWVNNWTQSMAINSPQGDMASAGTDLSDTLGAFQGNLEYGDQVIIDYDPESGTSVSVNGVKVVKEKSSTLFNLFLSTWIGPVPPNSQFKNAILGKADTKNDYTGFLAIKPTAVRVEAVKAWPTTLKEEEEKELAEAEAKKAEEEAVKKAEEEAEKKAKDEALAEEQRLALIEEEKQKAQEASRKAAEEAAKKAEAERAAAQSAQEDVDVSVEAILAQQDYTKQIIRKIYAAVSYPKSAVKNNQEGSVRAAVTVDRKGGLVKVVILEGSSFESLNEAALKAINKAAPFPEVPDAVKVDTIDLMVPIAFKLN